MYNRMDQRTYWPDGHPMRWGDWVFRIEQCHQERVIRASQLPYGRVSTVWIGLDQGIGDGPPLIFETMIFGKASEHLQHVAWRCATQSQAIQQHEEALELVRTLRRTSGHYRQATLALN